MTDIKLVYVKWLDHASLDTVGWIDIDQIHEMKDGLEVSTVGFVAQETDTAYKLVMSWAENGKMAQNMTVLKCAVLEYKELHVQDNVGKRKKSG